MQHARAVASGPPVRPVPDPENVQHCYTSFAPQPWTSIVRLAPLVLVLTLLAMPALAQAPQKTGDDDKRNELPGGDIFGFTDSTDVGDRGDRGASVENTLRAGKGGGTYRALGTKYELGATPVDRLSLSLAAFTAAHRIRSVPGLDDRRSIAFDGLSVEAVYQVLPRTGSGVAVALAVEPRWSRIDSGGGTRQEGFEAETKLFVDAILVPGKLYGALNLNYAPGVSREPGRDWERSSSTNVSAALAYQFTDKIFGSVEARFLSSFEGAVLNRNVGNALFVGPNVLVKIGESASLNVAWTPQVAGRARGSDRSLDLDNYERHQLRVKFSTSF
jgi:hypothetical protein